MEIPLAGLCETCEVERRVGLHFRGGRSPQGTLRPPKHAAARREAPSRAARTVRADPRRGRNRKGDTVAV